MAIASTVAHDFHHMNFVGTDCDQIALAANRLAEVSGSISLWRNRKELALVEMPFASLLFDRPAGELAEKAQTLVAAMADCGCALNYGCMQHFLRAIVVIPELRIPTRA